MIPPEFFPPLAIGFAMGLGPGMILMIFVEGYYRRHLYTQLLATQAKAEEAEELARDARESLDMVLHDPGLYAREYLEANEGFVNGALDAVNRLNIGNNIPRIR